MEHYVEDLNADTFSLRETENLEGETDSTVVAYEREYVGFTFDYTVEGTQQTGDILADGSLVLKLYYRRNSYNVSYRYTNHVPGESPAPATRSYEYGSLVTVDYNISAPGYTFSGWSEGETFTMPAEDVEITGSWTPRNDTGYSINYYIQDLNSNTFTVRENIYTFGTTGTEVTAEIKLYPGFTFDSTIEGTKVSGIVAGDNSLRLELYYTRNSYTVSYAYTSAPVSASLLPADQSYQYGAICIYISTSKC